MPKPFMFLIIGLFFGTGFGFILAATSGAQLEGHDHGGAAVHDHSAHGGEEHDHDALTEVTGPAPTLDLVFHPDGPQSRNLELKVSNFDFDATVVNGAHTPGRGHAHLYINGIKISRVYGPWLHLSALPKGTHEVRVTLNANDHSQLAVGGTPIEVTQTLVIE